ncbi:MAG: AlpA family phage regulatory protein [Methylococcaceae bacterium]
MKSKAALKFQPPALKPNYPLPAPPPQLLESGLLRLNQIVGDKKKNIPALIPICKTSFLKGVKDGRFPAPIQLTERTIAWKAQDIKTLINSMGA